VITGVHAIVFTENPDAVRAFFRDTLGLHSVDAGGGWDIVALPPAELAAHPADGRPHHQLYLMCDDLQATIDELSAKGVEVTGEITEERWGAIATLEIPGGGELALYEPRHPSPLLGG
jgi:predicted enzyme related to lactoylglutathione lyase